MDFDVIWWSGSNGLLYAMFLDELGIPLHRFCTMTKPIELTVEQAALASTYREKWQSVAGSTQPIDRQSCQALVQHLYRELGHNEPEILFYDSPHTALKDYGGTIERSPTLSQEFHAYDRKVSEQINLDIQLSLGSWNMLEVLRNIKDIGQWMDVNYGIIRIAVKPRLFRARI